MFVYIDSLFFLTCIFNVMRNVKIMQIKLLIFGLTLIMMMIMMIKKLLMMVMIN